MSITATEAPVQAASEPQAGPADDRREMLRDAEHILRRVEDALAESDRGVEQIEDLVLELCLLNDLPREVEELTADLICSDLTDDLGRCVRRLRKALAAVPKALAAADPRAADKDVGGSEKAAS